MTVISLVEEDLLSGPLSSLDSSNYRNLIPDRLQRLGAYARYVDQIIDGAE